MGAPENLPAIAWIRVALIAVALLILPAIAWLALPSPGPAVLASSSARRPEAGLPAEVSEPGDVPSAGRKVTGRVLDAEGNGIDGAEVSVKGGAGAAAVTTTRGGGKFTVRGPSTALTIEANAKGYALGRAQVPIGGDVTDFEITLRPGARVEGWVYDGGGKAVREAYVECAARNVFTTTDAEGHFSMPTDADGCSATATHPDYGTSPAITLTAGARNRFDLPSPGSISGVVVDEQGRGIAQYLLSVESYIAADGAPPSGPFGRNERVDEPSGAFELDGLAAGKYILVASGSGRPPQKSDPIELEAGRKVTGVRIVLGRGAILSGIITDRDTHAPIAGARVRLDAATVSGASGIAPATSDDTGRYSLEGVPSGAFSVRVSHKEYRDRIVSLSGNGSAEIQKDIDLSAAGDSKSTEMTGVGATLAMGTNRVEVAAVLGGGPAEAAGLKTGDRIERIDGENAESFTVSDCVQRLRGPEGTRVTVRLTREGSTIDLTITRAKIVR